MKHLKTFESFSINELQDWATLPVDVHANMGDLYGQVGRELKSALGSTYQKFMTTLESLDLSKLSRQKATEMLKAAEKFFGVDPLTLTADDVKKELKMEFPELTKESFLDEFDQTDPFITKNGEEERLGEPLNNIRGGFVQKFLSVIGTIFAINVFSLGFLGSWITNLMGFGVITNGFLTPYNPFFTMFVSMGAFAIVTIIRKLYKMVTGHE